MTAFKIDLKTASIWQDHLDNWVANIDISNPIYWLTFNIHLKYSMLYDDLGTDRKQCIKRCQETVVLDLSLKSKNEGAKALKLLVTQLSLT